jgi:trimeric autotransporter adhesin
MKKLLLFPLMCLLNMLSGNVLAQTVYSNTFPGTDGLSPFPGGTPSLTFSNTTGNSDATPGSASGISIGGPAGSLTLIDNQLATWTSVAPVLTTTNSGYAYTTAPISGYSAPFNTTLSSNTQLITWTFNMSTRTTSTGFLAGQNEAAVVLTANNPDIRSVASGYAVIFNPASPLSMQLVRYSGGLTGGVTPLITTGSVLTSATSHASVRVVYNPLTDLWTMYIRDDGATGFSDPSVGVTFSTGSVIDGTFTSAAATHFGFYSNYFINYLGIGIDAYNAYFDNFSVTLSCPEITGGLSTCVGLTTTLSNIFPGGTWTSSTPSIATVGLASGIVTGVASGTSTITYTVGTCEVTAVVTVNPLPVPPAITGASSICLGDTTVLSVLPAVAGSTWSSSAPTIATVNPTTGAVTSISAGTVSITYRVPTGCFSIKQMTINPVAAISGFPMLCETDVRTFYNAVPGGTWSSSDVTIASIDPTLGSLTAIAAGTATITYTTPASCYSVIEVTVNALPGAITGTFSVCEGMSTTLSSTTSGGFWSSSNETVATVTDAGLLIGNTAGTALITYKLMTGCLVTQPVTVNAQPTTIDGTTSVCVESTTTLSCPLAGGSWSSASTGIGTIGATTGIFGGIAAGTSVVTYMMPTGCFRTTIVTVNPTPAPITGLGSVCVGLTIPLTSSAGGTWQSSNTAVGTVGSLTGIVGGVSASTVTISYSFATGCRRTVVVTVAPLPSAISGVTSVCTGSTTALGNTSLGGTWSSSTGAVGTVGSSTGIVTGLTIGTTTIVYTIGTGCTASIVVTVIASPAAIGGTPIVCAGQTTTLTNTTTGGTWSSSNTTVATVDAAGIVTGNTGGTSTITYTGPNGCFETQVVTVNSLPGTITGTATVCVNATTTLGSTPGGGTWSSSTGAVGTINGGGVVTGISAGTTTITYTRLGCTRTTVVTVNALPTTFTPTTNALCLGTSVTFNSTPAGGTWSSSNTTNAPVGAATGTVSGNAVGTANITYTHPTNGCLRVRNISVNPLPATIGGSSTLCPATNVSLTNSSTGGTWASSNTAVGTIGSSSGILTGIITGTTMITYTLATGCITTTVVTVTTAPTAIITPLGDTTLCPGDFTTLTSTTSPGVIYEWLNSGTPIPGATSPIYTTSVSGSYQVRVTATAGCATLSAPMTVAVVPATATITVPGGTTSACSGSPVALNANTGAGLTYQWELGTTAIAGATASTYNATASGTYRVRVTNSAGCAAVSTSVTITITPAPANTISASGALTFCNGSNVTLSAAAGTGYTYQWYNSAGPITGATGVSYTATTSESYYVVVTNGSGCSTTSVTTVVVVNPLPNVAITPGGPRIFCSGGIVSLTAAPGFSYQWYRNGVAITGATNAAYVASATGGYRVRVTNATTGCSDMTHADTMVTVVTAPEVQALTPAKFCWGGSSLLSTNASYLGGAIGYQWFFNSTVIPGATNPTYSATVPGIYSCTIAVPSSCTASTGPITVTQVPLPDPPITFTGTALRTGNYYITYQWHKNLVAIPGATSYMTPSTGSGNYKVAVTDTNGCQSVSAVYVLNSTTEAANLNASAIRIFPNPASDNVYIESPVSVRAVIATADGKMISNTEQAKEISLKGLANGLYLISLYDNNGLLLRVEKLIKQ